MITRGAVECVDVTRRFLDFFSCNRFFILFIISYNTYSAHNIKSYGRKTI